jgi:dihydrolipoamide dehydrogenase
MSGGRFDVVVLGGGSAGYAAAIRASELGKSVAVVERDRVGGTCLHRGCVPTKAMLHAAELADAGRQAADAGIRLSFDGVDGAALAAYRDRIVGKKYAGLQSLLKARGITVVTGEGRLGHDRAVTVGDDVYTADAVVVATGAVTRTLPGVELGGRILSSETALALDHVPARVVVLGGGVIGVEFASLWRSLGAEVVIVEALDHLLPAEDLTLSRGLERAFRKRGIDLRLGARVAAVADGADAATVRLEDGTELTGDAVLVAVGRGPATAGLSLEDAGIRLDGGFVVTDERLRTTAPGVWAAGDIVRGPQLAHRGFQQGIFVAEDIAGLDPVPVPDAHVPRIAYSHPEVASVGITEARAIEELGADAVTAFEFNLAGNARSEILGTSGTVKVVRRVDGPVLGVHLIGDRVGELITEGQLAVAWEAHPEDLASLVHAHPTQSEALGEAFLALAGKPLHAL